MQTNKNRWYEVHVPSISYCQVEVEAENKEEAVKLLKRLLLEHEELEYAMKESGGRVSWNYRSTHHEIKTKESIIATEWGS